ncbi:hypothetical protein GCM10023091_31750 [Ravibacter arvi]|uniref:Secreted protein (Por secretion system target) n=1 Tax=Ravibacter arvi TaxID=2051041 RepID=A0ABP8M6F3_9BACT
MDNKIKVVSDYGSVFDFLTVQRGTFDFPTIEANSDGIKINTSNAQDHRFAMDLARSNMPGKLVMNELEFSGNDNAVINQIKECFNYGADLVAFFKLAEYLQAHSVSELQTIANDFINGSNGNVPVITPTQNATFTLSSMVDNGGCNTTDRDLTASDCDAYQNWRSAHNIANGPVQLTMINDITASLCATPCSQTINITSTTTNPSAGSNFTLTASCSGGDCSGITYTWSGNSINGTGTSKTITAPNTAGNYTYTVTASKNGCTNKVANITIGVPPPTPTGCYALRLKINNKYLTRQNSVLKVQNLSGGQPSQSQIWKIEEVGSYVKVSTTDGSNLSLGVLNAGQADYDEVVLQSYTGGDHQQWGKLLVNDGETGERFGFQRKNAQFIISSRRNWGDGIADANTDIQLAPISELNTHGASKWFLESKTCPSDPCTQTINISSTTTNPSAGSNFTLSASCSGGDCSGITYTWSGNGISGTGTSKTITAPNTAGNYTYTVTASKNGCTNKVANITIGVPPPTPTGCYALRLKINNKYLTRQNSVLKVQNLSGGQPSQSQIWKLEEVGSYVKVSTTDGSNLSLGVLNGGQADYDEVVLQSYTGGDHQQWSKLLVNDGETGERFGFQRKNAQFIISSRRNWGDGIADANTDIQLAPISELNTHGASKWFLESKTCPSDPCTQTINVTSTTTNPSAGSNFTLTASCSGGDCSGITYTWSGNGISGTGTSKTITAPNTAGNYTYTVTASKSGCTNKVVNYPVGVVNNNTVNCSSLSGDLNGMNCNGGIEGWIYDSSQPNLTLTVDLYEGTNLLVGNVSAGTFRQDLLNNGIGNGYHAFGFPVPTSLKNGQPHTLDVKVTGCPNYTLSNSPMTITCSPNARTRTEIDLDKTVDSVDDIVVSPNPNSGEFVVTYSVRKGKAVTLSVVDMQGTQLFTKRIVAEGRHKDKIALPSHTSGVFLVQLYDGYIWTRKKIVVAK